MMEIAKNRPLLPWEIFPELTDERLAVVAEIIRNAWSECLKRHEPSRGDNAWVLGCRAFRWTCFAITSAAVHGYEWLTIVDDSLKKQLERKAGVIDPEMHFVFAIGGVPLRFYHGKVDKTANKRTLRRQYPELQYFQYVLEFSDELPEYDLIFRLAVQTDETGEVTDIALVQLDVDGIPSPSMYSIPLDRPAKISQFRQRSEGRELPPPSVGRRKKLPEEKKG